MINRLGQLKSFDKKAKSLLDALSGEIEKKEKDLLYKEANDYFWEVFENSPNLRTRSWKKWKEIIVNSLDYIPKVLVILYSFQKEKMTVVSKIDNKYLIDDIWSFFRKIETDWEEREHLLYDYKELLKEEESYMWSVFSKEEKQAIIHLKKLERMNYEEQWEIDSALKEMSCFIMNHHPAKEMKTAFVILLRNHGITDLSFLAEST